MRRRLILVAAAVTSMVALAFLIPLAFVVRELTADRVLSAAERDAATVARLLSTFAPLEGIEAVANRVGGDGNLNSRELTIILPSGITVGAAPQATEDLQAARGGLAFRQEVAGGQSIYVPVAQSDGSIVVVRVFVDNDALTANVTRAWLTLALLGVVLVLVAVAVADRLGRSIVGPVKDLSKSAHRLGEGDLTARVEPAGPEEVVEVGLAFNRLAERVGRLLQRERESAADLSHRLRTPLTAVRLDAEALPEDERRGQLLDDLDGLERTVDLVIQEARRPVGRDEDPATDLAEIVAERTAFWQPLAEDRGREVTVEVPAEKGIMVPVARADLEAALDALLGNVLTHTPTGTSFVVRVHEGSDGVVQLLVDDAGPGFTDDDVLRRGLSGAGSTGLGLDIVRRTAAQGGGEVVLDKSPLGGGRVVVTFTKLAAD